VRVTDIIVRLRPEAARAFSGGTRTEGVAELETVLTRFGAELRQQHPDVSDPQLQYWYTASVESPDLADRIAAALGELDAVDAAYVQPRPHPA
jgi:hypothetical protein